MTKRKNQHFVPRVLLKPWSLNCEGKAIHLFNIRTDQTIKNAPVKNQCSRDYFYGADLQIENWLGRGEGFFAQEVRNLPSGNPSVTTQAMDFLRDFSFLQSIRTERSIAEDASMLREMYDQIYHTILPPEDDPMPTHEEIVRDAMLRWSKARHYLQDLKGVLIINKSNVPFVISDNPAIHTNRLHVQRFKSGSFGVQQAGMVLTMPISPSLAVLYYDNYVYKSPNYLSQNVKLTKDKDAIAFNQFQYLSARENLYFDNGADFSVALGDLRELSALRLKVHFKLSLLIPKNDQPSVFVAAPEGIIAPEGQSILNLQTMTFRPRLWPSQIMFRAEATAYSDGSGLGFVRKRWAAENGLTDRHKRRLSGVSTQWGRG